MTDQIHQQRILILDFGSQYSQLIARRVREIGVYCELHPYDVADSVIKAFKPKGVILSGGPETVTAETTPRIPQLIFDLGVPVLGICYGMQALARQCGGKVSSADHHEYGYASVEIHGQSALLTDIEDHVRDDSVAMLDVWMSHGDRVESLPEGFKVIAKTTNAPIAAIADEGRHYYGLQFHPEVTHTVQGERILSRFVLEICQCSALWTPSRIIDDAIEQVKQTVGNDHVILGLSGGVDSSVVAALLNKAIGKQLTCIFIDNGLLRLGEADEVMLTFGEHFGIKIKKIDASERFLSALVGVADPEAKRKVIGGLFIDVFEEEAQKIKDAKWLAQGTIYPDVIESAKSHQGKAHVIKSHHNVGGLPEKMNLGLVEPLRELFKDEVRRVGLELGLPSQLVYRHPFPGPGLSVRVLGEIQKPYLDILRQADKIFIDELHNHDYYYRVSQAFVVFMPVKSVGVVGDARQYEYVVSLRCVETTDFMTAMASNLSFEFLTMVANRIMNEVKGIARVVYDISSKPPATIEWE